MTITYTFEGSLYVNLTNRCPNACEFCLRTHGSSVGDADTLWLTTEPTREEVLADILKHDLTAFPELVFCGYGEPTCRLDDMLWICEQIRTVSGISIRINTNGLSDLINKRSTSAEFDGLVDTISISLNASSPEKYDAICHSEFGLDALPAILNFTRKVSVYVPKVILSVVDHNTPTAELEKCRQLCKETGAIFRVRKYIEN